MTPEEIRLRIDTLKQAIASGVQTVQYGDVRTTYRSHDEMERALRLLLAELVKAEGRAGPRQVRYIYQSGKGY